MSLSGGNCQPNAQIPYQGSLRINPTRSPATPDYRYLAETLADVDDFDGLAQQCVATAPNMARKLQTALTRILAVQFEHGMAARGRKRLRHSPLDANDVLEIRRDYQPGPRGIGNMGELARRYGVSSVTIHRIVTWQTWRDL